MRNMKEINYELIYTDFLGRRQIMNYIKSEKELLRRKNIYYDSEDCNPIMKKVVKTFNEEGDCIKIEKTIIKKSKS